jgi:hypothetical protein
MLIRTTIGGQNAIHTIVRGRNVIRASRCFLKVHTQNSYFPSFPSLAGGGLGGRGADAQNPKHQHHHGQGQGPATQSRPSLIIELKATVLSDRDRHGRVTIGKNYIRATDSGLPSLSSSQHLSTNMAIKAGDRVTTVPGSLPTMISDWKRRTTGNTFYDSRTSASNLHK